MVVVREPDVKCVLIQTCIHDGIPGRRKRWGCRVIGIPGDKDVRQKDNQEIVHKVAHPTVVHLTGGSLRGMQMAMRVQKSRPLQKGLGQEGRTGGGRGLVLRGTRRSQNKQERERLGEGSKTGLDSSCLHPQPGSPRQVILPLTWSPGKRSQKLLLGILSKCLSCPDPGGFCALSPCSPPSLTLGHIAYRRDSSTVPRLSQAVGPRDFSSLLQLPPGNPRCQDGA